jgi:hypothetical protein
MKILVLSVGAGIIVELLFQLLKFIDETEKSPPVPKYITYSRYISVNEFVAAGNRRWAKYLFFRLFPPALVFSLMVGIERKEFHNPHVLVSLLIAATVSIIPRDLFSLRKGRYTASFAERSVHMVNIISVYVVSIAIAVLNTRLNFQYIAPSISGVVDNLWSTLFVAVLFAFYNFVSRSPNYDSVFEKKNKEANYVIKIYRKLEERFGKQIDKLSSAHGTSRALIYAILIYEDMNRPSFVRYAERMIVKFTHKELTVGIAQVKSRKPLSDSASIEKAVENLKNTQPVVELIYGRGLQDYTELMPFLAKYNSNGEYARSVIDILSHLRQFAPLLFRESA